MRGAAHLPPARRHASTPPLAQPVRLPSIKEVQEEDFVDSFNTLARTRSY
jgi:hypothetical protein